MNTDTNDYVQHVTKTHKWTKPISETNKEWYKTRADDLFLVTKVWKVQPCVCI